MSRAIPTASYCDLPCCGTGDGCCECGLLPEQVEEQREYYAYLAKMSQSGRYDERLSRIEFMERVRAEKRAAELSEE